MCFTAHLHKKPNSNQTFNFHLFCLVNRAIFAVWGQIT